MFTMHDPKVELHMEQRIFYMIFVFVIRVRKYSLSLMALKA